MTKQIELTAEQKFEAWLDSLPISQYDPLRKDPFAKAAFAAALAIGRAEAQAVEPTMWQCRMRADWQKEWSTWTECTAGQADDYRRSPRVADWHYEVRALYTAPQPQGEAIELDCVCRATWVIHPDGTKELIAAPQQPEPSAELSDELVRVKKRYEWTTNELLACDYGDNEHKKIGWRIYGWRGRFGQHYIYGPSIDAAIDAEIAALETKRGAK